MWRFVKTLMSVTTLRSPKMGNVAFNMGLLRIYHKDFELVTHVGGVLVRLTSYSSQSDQWHHPPSHFGERSLQVSLQFSLLSLRLAVYITNRQ